VLVAVDGGGLRKLQEQAADLDLVAVEPALAADRTLETRPPVFVWLGADPVAGLLTVVALHKSRPDVRLLYVTPRAAEAERLTALESGVDEVLAEPISRAELAARIRLQLRRSTRARRTRLPIGEGLELDLDRRELLRDGDWLHLRPREALLLELFARAPGRVLTRHHILERIWGPNHDGDPRTVDVHVRWLRSKIEPDPHQPVWLLTVRGVGYRLDPGPLTER